MKSLIISLLIVGYSLNTITQATIQKDNNCSFFKNLKFKDGRDTIVVKAILYDYLQAPPKLSNIKPSIYKYKFDSYIAFQPENCLKKYSEPILNAADPGKLLNGDNLGLTVYLTCVIFNEHFLNSNGDPDCLVIKITPAIHSQIEIADKCNFLPHLNFRNGTDTVIITANYHAVFKSGSGLILNNLNKGHLLKAKDYEYGIGFQIPGCDEKIAPYHFKSFEEISNIKKKPEGTSIKMTCIVFEKYYSYGIPFFVIDSVETIKK